jgi:hypothetical protein
MNRHLSSTEYMVAEFSFKITMEGQYRDRCEFHFVEGSARGQSRFKKPDSEVGSRTACFERRDVRGMRGIGSVVGAA